MRWMHHSEQSWEPAATFEEKNKWLQAYKKRKKAQEHTVSAVICLTADLLSSPAESLTPEKCKQAGIQEKDVLFVYAGIPCETYSSVGRANKDRDLHKTVYGYKHRVADAERSPGCP